LNEVVRQTLVELVAREGRVVSDDPRRCIALLRDLCPGHKREISVLSAALDDGLVAGLPTSVGSAPVDLTIKRLAQRLVEDRGLGEGPAVWAVESWAIALGFAPAGPPASPASTSAEARLREISALRKQRALTREELLEAAGLFRALGRSARAEEAERAAAQLAAASRAPAPPSPDLTSRDEFEPVYCPRCKRQIPHSGDCAPCRAEAEGRRRREEEARTLEAAWRQGGLDPVGLVRLADLYERTGRAQEAAMLRAQIAATSQSSPSHPQPVAVAVQPDGHPTGSVSPAPALWNPDAAGVWSVFLTPVFGSVLLLRNWEALGELVEVQKAREWLIGSVMAVLLGPFVPALPLVYIVVWYMLFQRRQTQYVWARCGRSYPRRSWLEPLSFGVLGAIVYTAVVKALWLALASASE
jgi:hypothetical protein